MTTSFDKLLVNAATVLLVGGVVVRASALQSAALSSISC